MFTIILVSSITSGSMTLIVKVGSKVPDLKSTGDIPTYPRKYSTCKTKPEIQE